jgi:hypothetical protein
LKHQQAEALFALFFFFFSASAENNKHFENLGFKVSGLYSVEEQLQFCMGLKIRCYSALTFVTKEWSPCDPLMHPPSFCALNVVSGADYDHFYKQTILNDQVNFAIQIFCRCLQSFECVGGPNRLNFLAESPFTLALTLAS